MKCFSKIMTVGAVATAAFVMVSCTRAPKTQSEAKQKMEDCGYTVEMMTADEIAAMFGAGLDLGAKTAIVCEKATEEQALLAIWFNTKENAEDFKTVFKMTEGTFAEAFGDIETTYEVSGEVFYFGTLTACEDFTG